MKMFGRIANAVWMLVRSGRNGEREERRKEQEPDGDGGIVARLRREIERERDAYAASTTKNRTTAVNNLDRFLTAKGAAALPAGELTADHVRAFERWALDRGQVPNYVAQQLRDLRSLINRIDGRGAELFSKVSTAKCQTEKRSVGEQTIRSIRELHIADPKVAMSRDIFMLCFCCMGMPLVDAVHLRKSDVRDGRITFFRTKTRRRVTMQLTPEIETLIGRLSKGGSPYLLPVLGEGTKQGQDRAYRNFYQQNRRALMKISEMVGDGCHLTSYTPRHTWASIAFREQVHVNVISRALGHASTAVTATYIRDLGDAELAEANRRVLLAIG